MPCGAKTRARAWCRRHGAVGAQGFCNDREERWDKSHTTHLAPHGRGMGDAERWRSLAGLGLSGHDRRGVDQGLWDFQQGAGAAITASPGRLSRALNGRRA